MVHFRTERCDFFRRHGQQSRGSSLVQRLVVVVDRLEMSVQSLLDVPCPGHGRLQLLGRRLCRQVADGGAQSDNALANGGGSRIQELELPNQTVVERDRQVGRKPHRIDFEIVQRGLKRVLGLQQSGLLRLDGLSQVVDLDQRDEPGRMVRLEFGKLIDLERQAVFGVAELLKLLQQSDESAHRTGTAAGKAGPRAAASA